MARSTPPPKGAFWPPNDSTTYRDLLLFEERLKTNAASLQRRKSRYQLFLVQLLLVILFLLIEVFSQSSFLTIPYKFILQHTLPDMYTPEAKIALHPYLASGLLTVSVTTLVLFFASGMYSEKIGYANKYVPHANRALRSFNMYLNVRKPPLRSKFYYNPLTFFFPRTPPPPSSTPGAASSPSRSHSTSPHGGAALPLMPIPPSTNPRGELIFSSRVDRTFKESYERYRAAFERKREEREREEKGKRGWRGWIRWITPARWRQENNRAASGVSGSATPSRTPSAKGRPLASRSGTPPTSGGGSIRNVRNRTPPVGVSRQGSQRGRRDVDMNGDMRTFALEKSLLADR